MSYQQPSPWDVGDEPPRQRGQQPQDDPYQLPLPYYEPPPQPRPRRKRTVRGFLITMLLILISCTGITLVARALHPIKAVHPVTTALTGSGTGTNNTPDFTTGPDWSITYSFTCSGPASQDAFVVTVYDGSQVHDTPVDVHAAKGSGTGYEHGNPGTHHLSVQTSCRWTFTVNDGAVEPSPAG